MLTPLNYLEFMRILVFDDDEVLGQEFTSVVDKSPNCSVELSLICPSLYPDNLASFDLIFLDYIRTGQKNIIDILKIFEEKKIIERTIVFSSTFENYAFEILKPFNIFSFMPRDSPDLFIEQLVFYFSKEHQVPKGDVTVSKDARFTIVKKKNFYVKLKLQDVEHIEVDEKYLIYSIAETKYMVRDSLSNFMSMHGDLFIRVHGKHAINKSTFLKLDYKEQVIYLENNATLPLSKHYRSEFYEYYSILN